MPVAAAGDNIINLVLPNGSGIYTGLLSFFFGNKAAVLPEIGNRIFFTIVPADFKKGFVTQRIFSFKHYQPGREYLTAVAAGTACRHFLFTCIAAGSKKD